MEEIDEGILLDLEKRENEDPKKGSSFVHVATKKKEVSKNKKRAKSEENNEWVTTILIILNIFDVYKVILLN